MKVSFIAKHEFDEDQLIFLRTVGHQFFMTCNFSKENANKTLENLLERHSEKQRHYHDLSHLYNLYLLKNEYEKYLKNQLLIEAAIWFHDAIYLPKRKDNEIKTAELAVEILQEKNLPFELNDLKLLIESTAKHQPLSDNSDFHYFLDFDLGILAAEPAVYKTYTQAIREEYSMYPNLLYKVGRKKMLKSFLQRERIYFSKDFFEKYEKRARANLLEEMALL